MKKNLNVDHYRNGDSIPEVRDSVQWINLTTGAWCYYKMILHLVLLRKLYNWYAVTDPRGLSPVGWHVSSDMEWNELEHFLGNSSIAGGKLKSNGTIESGKVYGIVQILVHQMNHFFQLIQVATAIGIKEYFTN